MVAPAGIEPATHGASVRCSTNWATEPWRSRRELNPRSSPWQGDVLNHFTTGPNWWRRLDLNQRPQGYEPCEMPNFSTPRCEFINWCFINETNGGWWGIRTPAGREAPGSFQDCSLQPDLGNHPWWTQQDSNL